MPERQQVFVISLLLSDSEEPDELVLGVRRSVTQAPRHPGVLSTPTQRVPADLFAACQPWWPPPRAGTEPTVVDLDDTEATAPIGGPGTTSAIPLSYAVETLLCRKLDLTQALATHRVAGIATPVAVAAGHVDDPKGQGQTEATVMLTMRVLLAGLREALPTGTAFFDPLLLSPIATFVRAVEQNDALVVDPGLDPFEICIDGLCVVSGAAVIRRGAAR